MKYKGIFFNFLTITCWLLTSLVFFLLSFKACWAAPILGLKPTNVKDINLSESLNPKDSKDIEFVTVNLSDKNITIKLKVANLDKTADDGSFIFENNQTSNNGVKLFVKPGLEKIKLGPGERKNFKINITIPQDALPGEYLGGLIASDADSDQQLAVSKLDIMVQGTLSREIKASLEKEIKNDQLILKFNIKNIGNTKIDNLAVYLDIKNTKLEKLFNIERKAVIPSEIVILPGESAILEKQMDFKLDPIGNYFINAEIKFGGNQPFKIKEGFTYTSFKKLTLISLITIVGLSILAFFGSKFFYWYGKKRQTVKEINQRWNQVVNDLLEGKPLNNTSSKFDDKALQKTIQELKKDIKQTIKDELKQTETNIGKKINKNSEYVKENIELTKMSLARHYKTAPKYLVYMGKKKSE